MMASERFALSLCLVGFCFGLATLWLPHAWPFVFMQFLLALALLILSIQALRTRQPRPWTSLLLLPFAVSLLAAIQLLTQSTLDPWETRRTAFEWAGFGLAAVLGFQLFQDPNRRLKLLRGFVYFSAVLCLYSVAQNYAVPGRVWWVFDSGYQDQVFGPFVYHTKFANFVELAIAPALFLASGSTRDRWIHWGIVVFLIASVVASASRGGILVVAVEVVVLLTFHFRSSSQRLAPGRFSLLFAAALGLACYLIGFEPLSRRITASEALSDTRWAIQVSNFAMAKQYFWTGAGLGSWPALYPEFAVFDNSSRINQAHCDWMQWLIEGGLPMFFITMTIFVVSLRAASRQWWAFGFVFVWLHGLIDYSMHQTPALSALLFAFWGVALHALKPPILLDHADR